MSLTRENAAALLRWRLVLGAEAERADPLMSLSQLLADPVLDQESLSVSELEDLDETLEFVYGQQRTTGLTAYIPKWLERVRHFFRSDVVALVQKDAIEKKGLTRLLFEPETLPYLEKTPDLVATLLAAQALVPDDAKEMARKIVREVVDELRRKLQTQTRTAILGAVKRNTRSPFKVARNLDWRRTVQRNLHTYDARRKRLVPESFHFLANQRRQGEWDVVILVDQSGSMAVSVIYSSIMAAIFASLDVLKTRLAFFNDQTIVDMTPHLNDPVDILFSAQLGGAENYNLALDHAKEHFIQRPEKTLLFFITDLFHTAGDNARFLRQVQELVESDVKFMVLLKLSDAGQPNYNRELAQELARLGAHCFGSTPKLLIEIMERILKHQPYEHLARNPTP
ncbi:MAG TPA: VWA domain-containing protein [Gammaproteobacteria bacterium]|nr:VWA domain-containing protein [Gammaproteobacteria bacterium]